MVLDNLCKSSPELLKQVQALAGKPLHFIEGDMHDPEVLHDVFSNHISVGQPSATFRQSCATNGIGSL
jgi:hypothetical protein